jgi:hypothetical protein
VRCGRWSDGSAGHSKNSVKWPSTDANQRDRTLGCASTSTPIGAPVGKHSPPDRDAVLRSKVLCGHRREALNAAEPLAADVLPLWDYRADEWNADGPPDG